MKANTEAAQRVRKYYITPRKISNAELAN